MDHHVIADIDAHMGNLRGIVGAHEENEITGLCIGVTDGSAEIAQPLRRCAPDIPAAVIEHPTDKAGAVKAGAW